MDWFKVLERGALPESIARAIEIAINNNGPSLIDIISDPDLI